MNAIKKYCKQNYTCFMKKVEKNPVYKTWNYVSVIALNKYKIIWLCGFIEAYKN